MQFRSLLGIGPRVIMLGNLRALISLYACIQAHSREVDVRDLCDIFMILCMYDCISDTEIVTVLDSLPASPALPMT